MSDPTTPMPFQPTTMTTAQLAAVSFLARYSGRTHSLYAYQLREWFAWCESNGLDPLVGVQRAHVELYIRGLGDHGLMDSSVNTMMHAVRGYFRFAHIDGLIGSDPAVYARLPKIHRDESRTQGLDRLELIRFLQIAQTLTVQHGALAYLLGINALQIREGAVLDGQGLGDLEEPDQFEPVQSLGAGLVAVDLRQPRVDGRVGADEAVDVGEAEVPADGVHHRVDRGVHQAVVAEPADVQLDVGALDPDQRVQPVALAPGEPLPQLVGVQAVGAPGVAGQVGHRRQLRGRHRCRLERHRGGRIGHGVTSRGDPSGGPDPARRQRGQAPGPH